jgi:hypothetical protein
VLARTNGAWVTTGQQNKSILALIKNPLEPTCLDKPLFRFSYRSHSDDHCLHRCGFSEHSFRANDEPHERSSYDAYVSGPWAQLHDDVGQRDYRLNENALLRDGRRQMALRSCIEGYYLHNNKQATVGKWITVRHFGHGTSVPTIRGLLEFLMADFPERRLLMEFRVTCFSAGWKSLPKTGIPT